MAEPLLPRPHWLYCLRRRVPCSPLHPLAQRWAMGQGQSRVPACVLQPASFAAPSAHTPSNTSLLSAARTGVLKPSSLVKRSCVVCCVLCAVSRCLRVSITVHQNSGRAHWTRCLLPDAAEIASQRQETPLERKKVTMMISSHPEGRTHAGCVGSERERPRSSRTRPK